MKFFGYSPNQNLNLKIISTFVKHIGNQTQQQSPNIDKTLQPTAKQNIDTIKKFGEKLLVHKKETILDGW